MFGLRSSYRGRTPRMSATVVVIQSPYSSVKNGGVGRVIERKFVGTEVEVWRVSFPGDTFDWWFRPPRFEVNGSPEIKELA